MSHKSQFLTGAFKESQKTQASNAIIHKEGYITGQEIKNYSWFMISLWSALGYLQLYIIILTSHLIGFTSPLLACRTWNL